MSSIALSNGVGVASTEHMGETARLVGTDDSLVGPSELDLQDYHRHRLLEAESRIRCCWSACDRNRMVLGGAVMLVSAIVLVAATLGPAIALLRKDFPTLAQCTACLSSGRVFNESADGKNGTCLANASLAFFAPTELNCPSCVDDPQFCGAAECKYKQSFPGVRPTPYWMMFVSTLCGLLLSAAINALKMFVWVPIKKSCCGFIDEEWESLGDNDDYRGIYVVANVLGATDPYWFLLLYATSIAHFVYIAQHVTTSPLYATGWQRYEAVYMTWLNSGTIEVVGIYLTQCTTMVAILKWANATDEAARDRGAAPLPKALESTIWSIAAPLVNLSNCSQEAAAQVTVAMSLPLLPYFFTHLIPGLIVFLPMLLLWCFGFGLLAWFVKRGFDSPRLFQRRVRMVASVVVVRVAGTFLVVVSLQTFTNYMVLLGQGKRWDRVVVEEFSNRQTLCYANALLNQVGVYSAGLTGLLLS